LFERDGESSDQASYDPPPFFLFFLLRLPVSFYSPTLVIVTLSGDLVVIFYLGCMLLIAGIAGIADKKFAKSQVVNGD